MLAVIGRQRAEEAATHPSAERRRGPVAILVTDPKMYGVACTYAALGLSKLTMRVFRDFDDADLWLAAETSLANLSRSAVQHVREAAVKPGLAVPEDDLRSRVGNRDHVFIPFSDGGLCVLNSMTVGGSCHTVSLRSDSDPICRKTARVGHQTNGATAVPADMRRIP
jgi:hypothetical protein